MNAHFPVPDTASAAARPAPRFELPKGTVVRLGADGAAAVRTLVVTRRTPAVDGVASQLMFDEVPSGAVVFLDDLQIAFLCGKGEFRVVFDPDGAGASAVPPSHMRMTAADEAECDRRRAYVDACIAAGSGSRPVLERAIADLASERGDAAPPGVTSVLRWRDTWTTQGGVFGQACLMRKANPGNRTSRLSSPLVMEAVERGVLAALRMPKGTGANARDLAFGWLRERDPDAGPEALPTIRTFQERMTGTNRYVADSLSFGEDAARRKRRATYERKRPDLPLEAVDCDHTPLDVLVVDETRKVVFGRPDFIAFRDRCTGYPLGMSMSFEAPSYAAFMAGLRHAIYPKDMSEYPGLGPWEAFGRFKRLHVDNALHFIGANIRRAGATLGYQIAEFRPGEPWLKGAEERLMKEVGARVHHLDGSTYSDVEERKRFEAVTGKPILTIGELRAYLAWWMCDEYAVNPHEGLGMLGTLKGVPRDLWRSRIGDVRLAPLPPRSEFVALAGDATERMVNRRGIRWDHIRYVGAGLDEILLSPEHRNGRWEEDRRGTRHEGVRYLVRRDPFDLGQVYVTNHHRPGSAPIKVPAARSDYAAGLTLHQHRVTVANADKELLAAADDPEEVLARTHARVDRFVQFLLTEREHQGVQRKLARYLERGRRDEARSVVTNEPVSRAMSRSVLDPTDPQGMPSPATRSPDAPAVTRESPPEPGTEAEGFAFGDGLPGRRDRGEDIAAAMEARRRALDAADAVDAADAAAPTAPATPAPSAEARRAARHARWDLAPTDADDDRGAPMDTPNARPGTPPAEKPSRRRRERPPEVPRPDGAGRAAGEAGAGRGARPAQERDELMTAEERAAEERRQRRSQRWENQG